MAPKKSNKPSKVEKKMDKSLAAANTEHVSKETSSPGSPAATAEVAPSGSSSPGEGTAPKHMDLRRTPCLACVEHLISWMPSDEGVMYCQEGTSTATCARCENAGIQCTNATGVLKKPSTNLHTALSKTIRHTESVKYFQDSVRAKLRAEEIRSCEDNRDWVADELSEKMEPFFESLRRSSRIEGFQRAMDLAIEAVRDCKGGCHCLLRGCTMGSKVAISVAQEEAGEGWWLNFWNMKREMAGKMNDSGGDKSASEVELWKRLSAAEI